MLLSFVRLCYNVLKYISFDGDTSFIVYFSMKILRFFRILLSFNYMMYVFVSILLLFFRCQITTVSNHGALIKPRTFRKHKITTVFSRRVYTRREIVYRTKYYRRCHHFILLPFIVHAVSRQRYNVFFFFFYICLATPSETAVAVKNRLE